MSRSVGFVRGHVDGLLRKKRRIGFSVYYLVENGEVVYVGCTSNPTQRQSIHRRRWSSIKLKVQCVVETQEEGERLERELISRLRLRGVDLRNSSRRSTGRSPGGSAERGIIPISDAFLRKMMTKQRRQEIRRGIEGGAKMALIDK